MEGSREEEAPGCEGGYKSASLVGTLCPTEEPAMKAERMPEDEAMTQKDGQKVRPNVFNGEKKREYFPY